MRIRVGSLIAAFFAVILASPAWAKEKYNQVQVVGHDPPTYSCPNGYTMVNNMCQMTTKSAMMSSCSIGVTENGECITFEEPLYHCPDGYMPFQSSSKGKYASAQQCMQIEHAAIEEVCSNGATPSSQGCVSTHTIPATMTCPVTGPYHHGGKYHSGSSDCVTYETVEAEKSCNPGYNFVGGMCVGTQSYPCTYEKTKTHYHHPHVHHTHNHAKKNLRALKTTDEAVANDEVANDQVANVEVANDEVANVEVANEQAAGESDEVVMMDKPEVGAVDSVTEELKVLEEDAVAKKDVTEAAAVDEVIESSDEIISDGEEVEEIPEEMAYKVEEYTKDDGKKKDNKSVYAPPKMCQTTIELQPNTYCPAGTVQTSGHMHHWHSHEGHKGGNHHDKKGGFSCVKATQVPLEPTCTQGVMDSTGYSCTIESYEPAIQKCPTGYELCSHSKSKYSANQCCVVNYAPPEAMCSDGSIPVNSQCKFTHPMTWSCPPGTQIVGDECVHTEITPVKVQYTIHIETTEPMPAEKKEKVHHVHAHHEKDHAHHTHHHHGQHGHHGHHGQHIHHS